MLTLLHSWTSRAGDHREGLFKQRGWKWYYKFRGLERNPSTGDYPWITKGGFDTRKEAWTACRDAMREADLRARSRYR